MDKFNEAKKAVINLVNTKNNVSYVEIERLFDELGFDWRGEGDIVASKCENIIFWSGWNKEALRVMNELLTEKLIDWEPCEWLIYFIDGKTLELPIVKKPRMYKTTHWLPRVFTIAKR